MRYSLIVTANAHVKDPSIQVTQILSDPILCILLRRKVVGDRASERRLGRIFWLMSSLDPVTFLVIATRRSSPPGLPCLFCKICLFLLTSVWVWQSQNTSLRLQRSNTIQSMAPPVSLELDEWIVALRYELNIPDEKCKLLCNTV